MARLRPVYEARYGLSKLTDEAVRRVRNAEAELTRCQGCGGQCRGMGYTRPVIATVTDYGQIRYELCEWGLKRRLERKCHGGEFPNRYFDKTFADYEITADNERAVGYAKWFVLQRPERGLYMHGGTGTGKTFLAALVAKEFIRRGAGVVFGDVPALMEGLKRSFDKGGTEELMRRYTSAELLVLDDMGAGQMTEWNVGVLYQILNLRYNAQRTIVVTSNYAPEMLERRLGKVDAGTATRIISRLSEMCKAVYLGTTDRRTQGC